MLDLMADAGYSGAVHLGLCEEFGRSCIDPVQNTTFDSQCLDRQGQQCIALQ